jgi:hypothetical protein
MPGDVCFKVHLAEEDSPAQPDAPDFSRGQVAVELPLSDVEPVFRLAAVEEEMCVLHFGVLFFVKQRGVLCLAA